MQMQRSLYEVAGGLSGPANHWGAHGLHSCTQADPRQVFLSLPYPEWEQVSLFLPYTQAAGHGAGGM